MSGEVGVGRRGVGKEGEGRAGVVAVFASLQMGRWLVRSCFVDSECTKVCGIEICTHIHTCNPYKQDI